MNCGYGHGYSVRELLSAVADANGAPLNIVEKERRAGDPPSLIAVADRAREILGWSPSYDNLEAIVTSALDWERRLAAHDESAYWAD